MRLKPSLGKFLAVSAVFTAALWIARSLTGGVFVTLLLWAMAATLVTAALGGYILFRAAFTVPPVGPIDDRLLRRRRSDEIARRGRRELENGHVMAAADLYREAMQAMTAGRLDLAEDRLDLAENLNVSRLLEEGARDPMPTEEINSILDNAARSRSRIDAQMAMVTETDRILREIRALDDGPTYDTSDIGDIGTEVLKERYTAVWQQVYRAPLPASDEATNALRMMQDQLRMRGLHVMWELNSTSPFFIEGPRGRPLGVSDMLRGQAQIRNIEPEANGDFCVTLMTRDGLFEAASRFAAVHNCFPDMLFVDIQKPDHRGFLAEHGLALTTMQRLLRGQLAESVAMYGMTLVQRSHGPMEVSHSHPSYTAPRPAAPPAERLRHLDL